MTDMRGIKHSKWAWIGLAAVLVLALAYAAQRGLQHARGVPDRSGGTPGGVPQRVISLAPSITETLFALGLGDRVVGVTRYCDYPPAAQQRASVGGYYDPNYEAITGLSPDLVILLPDHKKPRTFLTERGFNVLTVSHSTIGGILDSIRAIAETCGAPERAEPLLHRIEARVDAVRRRTRGLPQPRVMIVVGRDIYSKTINDVYIAGSAGWYTELIELAGGVNAYEGKLAFPSVSAEGILNINPDVIIEMLGNVTGEASAEGEARVAWQALPQIEAVREARVHLFREDVVIIPGPRFPVVLEKLARLLHPDLPWGPIRDSNELVPVRTPPAETAEEAP